MVKKEIKQKETKLKQTIKGDRRRQLKLRNDYIKNIYFEKVMFYSSENHGIRYYTTM